jgi:hypothetical protein
MMYSVCIFLFHYPHSMNTRNFVLPASSTPTTPEPQWNYSYAYYYDDPSSESSTFIFIRLSQTPSCREGFNQEGQSSLKHIERTAFGVDMRYDWSVGWSPYAQSMIAMMKVGVRKLLWPTRRLLPAQCFKTHAARGDERTERSRGFLGPASFVQIRPQ